MVAETGGEYMYIPESNIYNGVHIRNNRHDLTGIYPIRHSRPRPYRGYPYGQPDSLAADSMARYTGEWSPSRGYNAENATPEIDLRTINRFRPRARFW